MRHETYSAALVIACALASIGAASTARAVEDARFTTMARLNRNTVVEGAGCHGSWGYWTGASMSVVNLSPNEARGWQAASQVDEDPSTIQSRAMPQVQLIKGTPWPVDFGLSLAQTSDAAARRVTGYAQWTIYEDLARPALALRASHSQLTLTGNSDTASDGLEAVASMGLFRYFQVYGTVAGYSHTATLRDALADTSSLVPVNETPSRDESRRWSDWSASAGAQIRIFTPFFYLAIENRLDNGRSQTVTGKASMAL